MADLDLAAQVAVSLGDFAGALIKDFWQLLDPFATAINDAQFQFLSTFSCCLVVLANFQTALF